jgi:hypothetical protein
MIDLWDFVKWEKSPAAKRPPGMANKWSCQDWKKFYTKVEAADQQSVDDTVVLFDKTSLARNAASGGKEDAK